MERDAGERTAVLRAAEYLRLVSIDGLIHPREVCAAVGEDYENKPWIFMNARELVNELDGITFAPSGERDGRYRRLASSAGVSYAGKTALKRTRNAANRGRKRIQNALRVANDISDDERRRAGQQITARPTANLHAANVHRIQDRSWMGREGNLAGVDPPLERVLI